ncbi:MAG: polysaccharide deacetylase family protein [Peptococcaceae bacterium]|nr:polysaccharide deacetylase family protein [Peptococcaceae bacterium]
MSRQTAILSVISLFLVILIVVLSVIIIKYLPGYRLSSLLDARDYSAAAKLIGGKKNNSGVSKTLGIFANTYVADASDTGISDSVFVSKYADISVLKNELSDPLYTSTHEHITTLFGSGTITAEQCLANIDRIDTFNMLGDTKETLLNETEAIRTSKQGFLEGNDYINNNDYESALIALNEVIEKDSENYAKLADLKEHWKAVYFDTALAQAKEYFATEQYLAAFNSLFQLNKFLPGDPTVTALLPEYEHKKRDVPLQDVSTASVNHIFTHCLVAYPELSISTPGGGTYDIDCITATEFKRLLEQLYSNSYILIDINSLYEIRDGKAVKKDTIKVPQGKKPLVISFDDVVYDPEKTGNGMVDKLVLKNGRIQSYTEMPDGAGIYAIDNEFVPIMDDFVKKHPDFSLNGAKGTLCLTGFCGILGYRTHQGSPNRDAEIEAVKPVIQKLKNTGWNFASHSYAHHNMPKVSDELFLKDIQQWHDEVESLVGKTHVYVYAFGAWSPYDSEKHRKLMEEGFKIFCGVGADPYFIQGFPKTDDETGTLFMDRRPIDGFNLRERHTKYRSMIDTHTIYDHEARYIKFPKP